MTARRLKKSEHQQIAPSGEKLSVLRKALRCGFVLIRQDGARAIIELAREGKLCSQGRGRNAGFYGITDAGREAIKMADEVTS